ncbi:MAG: GNAT family N-acetyltransferase [Acidobacteriota bacterium]
MNQLEALRLEWSALWDRCPGATPFQSPEWLIPWWSVFGPGHLALVEVRERGRLTGLAPLYEEDGVRRFLGAGISDYQDILAESDAAAAAIVERLRGARCDLLEVPQHSPLAACGAEASVCSVCPTVPLPARRHRKRLADASYEIERGPRHSEYLEALFRLHTAEWEKRSSPGVLADARVRDFHRLAAAAFAARGWLRLYGLRYEGALRAVLYAFAARKRVYLYLSGFDPELSARSPGTRLLDFALEHSAECGLAEADFLRGNEPYKYLWGARDRPNYHVYFRSDG